jgi:hypothetical protein
MRGYGQRGSLGLLSIEGVYGSGTKAARKRQMRQAVLDLAVSIQTQARVTKKGS